MKEINEDNNLNELYFVVYDPVKDSEGSSFAYIGDGVFKSNTNREDKLSDFNIFLSEYIGKQ